jgi:protein-export membrane protein SecD
MKNQSPTARSLFGLVLLTAMVFAGCSKGPPKHGTRLTVVPTNSATAADQQQALARAAETLRVRFRGLGVRRAAVELAADGRLVVSLPEMSPESLGSCRRAIENVGLLEFRMVHPESGALIAAKIPEPGFEILEQRSASLHGDSITKYLVKKEPERGLTGKHIRKASVSRDRMTNKPEIAFEFDKAGAALFADVTSEYSPRNGIYHQLAIVLNGRLMSAPRIHAAITGGNAVINGDFSMEEATELAAALENPLDVPLRIVDEKRF